MRDAAETRERAAPAEKCASTFHTARKENAVGAQTFDFFPKSLQVRGGLAGFLNTKRAML